MAIMQCRAATCNYNSAETAEIAEEARKKAPAGNQGGAALPSTGAVQISRQVLGAQNGYCQYRESTPSGINIDCNLNGEQRQALASYYQRIDNAQSLQNGFNIDGGNLQTTVIVDGQTIVDVSNQLVMQGVCKVSAPPSSTDTGGEKSGLN